MVRPRLTINRRYTRAMQVTAQIMHIISPYLKDEDWEHRDISRELMDLFISLGVEVITEADRIQAGLEPRDHNGLTLDEIAAIDSRLMNAMLQPLAPFVLKSDKDK